MRHGVSKLKTGKFRADVSLRPNSSTLLGVFDTYEQAALAMAPYGGESIPVAETTSPKLPAVPVKDWK